ncbi:MAG: flagellar basal body P-ring formation protein FlgA [Campylobacterales bacterium]|nr:flagellar basal body P-ring formation protein FlgA [Campylobacterales bacterium]
MLFKLFFTLLLGCSLGATEYLKSNYFIHSDSVMLSDVVNTPQQDTLLYSLDANKHTKRVKASELITLLKNHGYREYTSKHTYIQFSKKSPVNTAKIEKALLDYYKKNYKNIHIKSLELHPRSYLQSLPKEYSFGIEKSAYLSNKGYCFIVTPKRKKIFFSYTLFAHVDAYFTNQMLSRGTELSNINAKKKSIMLQKFRAMPLQELPLHTFETKHRLKQESLITSRDIVGLYLVKRGDSVNVTLKNEGIAISFQAEAITNGRFGESILLRTKENKKINARVVGTKKAEM